MGRSIASQIEFWASLGMIMERVLTGSQQVNVIHKFSHEELLERLESVDKPEGRARLQVYLKTRPFPRFWAHPTEARVFIREDADGTETVGRFQGRDFVIVDIPKGRRDAEPSATDDLG